MQLEVGVARDRAPSAVPRARHVRRSTSRSRPTKRGGLDSRIRPTDRCIGNTLPSLRWARTSRPMPMILRHAGLEVARQVTVVRAALRLGHEHADVFAQQFVGAVAEDAAWSASFTASMRPRWSITTTASTAASMSAWVSRENMGRSMELRARARCTQYHGLNRYSGEFRDPLVLCHLEPHEHHPRRPTAQRARQPCWPGRRSCATA